MQSVSDLEILKRLQLDNPWWEQGDVDKRYSNYPNRDYFARFYQLISDKSLNRAVILLGPRRVGKTVMVYQSIHTLVNKAIQANTILYLSLETPVYTGLSLEQLVNRFVELHGHHRKSDLYIFFDEIQYLKDWEIHLKSLVDTYPDYKFIATGSAAAALRLKSRESGAGRFTEFLLPPLTFAEFLSFIERETELITREENGEYAATDIDELNREFVNYLNYGGYPEAVFSRAIQEDSARYIKSDIIDKVLLRDLPSLYGIYDIQELNSLFTTIAYNTGNEVSYEALSQNSGAAKNTLKRYLEYLEAAFLIKIVHRIDQNAKQFKRATTFKVYLTNPSMRAALFGAVSTDDEAMGNLTETAIFSQWLHSDYIRHLYYARWKEAEVDIVGLSSSHQKPNWALEIKWTDEPVTRHDRIKGLLRFVSTNQLNEARLTSKTIKTRIDKGEFIIDVIPSALLTFTLGKNILTDKNRDYDWSNIGNALNDLGRFDEAVEAYQKVASAFPDDKYVWYNLGDALGKRGKFNEAIKAFRKQLEVNPDHEHVWNYLGVTLYKKEKFDEAIDAYLQQLNTYPQHKYVLENLGMAYWGKGDLEQAAVYLDKHLQNTPNALSALSNDMELALIQQDKPRLQKRFNAIKPLLQDDQEYFVIVPFLFWLANPDTPIQPVLNAIQQYKSSEKISWNFADTRPTLKFLTLEQREIAERLISFFEGKTNFAEISDLFERDSKGAGMS